MAFTTFYLWQYRQFLRPANFPTKRYKCAWRRKRPKLGEGRFGRIRPVVGSVGSGSPRTPSFRCRSICHPMVGSFVNAFSRSSTLNASARARTRFSLARSPIERGGAAGLQIAPDIRRRRAAPSRPRCKGRYTSPRSSSTGLPAGRRAAACRRNANFRRLVQQTVPAQTAVSLRPNFSAKATRRAQYCPPSASSCPILKSP